MATPTPEIDPSLRAARRAHPAYGTQRSAAERLAAPFLEPEDQVPTAPAPPRPAPPRVTPGPRPAPYSPKVSPTPPKKTAATLYRATRFYVAEVVRAFSGTTK